MNDRFYQTVMILARILTSPILWWTVGSVAALIGLVLLYREGKFRAMGKLTYDREFSTDGVFAGEELELIETISNPGWFPLFSLRLNFFMPGGVTIDGITCTEHTKLTSVFHIPPFSTVEKRHTVRADKRDHFRIYEATISYRKNEVIFTSPIDFYAYPNNLHADASLSPDLFHAGDSISNRKYIEDPFFLSGIRPYRPGDPLRAVNFKASVRSYSGGVRRLMCNNYDSSRNFDSMMVIDLNSYPEAPMDNVLQLETALHYACYLFCEAIKNGGRVGFSANCAMGDDPYVCIPCNSGDMHVKNILEHFADISVLGRRDFSITAMLSEVAPDLPAGTDLYLITPYVDHKTAKLLHTLERAGRNVCVIPLSARRIAT